MRRSRRDGRGRKSEEAGGSNDPSDGLSLATASDESHESVWKVARYETMTAIGLRTKGKMFSDLWPQTARWAACLRCGIHTCGISHTSFIVAFAEDSPMCHGSVR